MGFLKRIFEWRFPRLWILVVLVVKFRFWGWECPSLSSDSLLWGCIGMLKRRRLHSAAQTGILLHSGSISMGRIEQTLLAHCCSRRWSRRCIQTPSPFGETISAFFLPFLLSCLFHWTRQWFASRSSVYIGRVCLWSFLLLLGQVLAFDVSLRISSVVWGYLRTGFSAKAL